VYISFMSETKLKQKHGITTLKRSFIDGAFTDLFVSFVVFM